MLEVAAEVLAVNPSASLAEVAAAAGIGRTTLHKQYATRQDLLVAVAHAALNQAEQAINAAVETAEKDARAGLEQLVRELAPLGAGLAFLFRQPALEEEPAIKDRLCGIDPMIAAVGALARKAGLLRDDRPGWWFVSTLYAQIYVAWEGVAVGRLAALDAPALVLSTLLEGLGPT
ncbi:TetR/AcrR family transcriptional regulator [Flindersiella endophytica]